MARLRGTRDNARGGGRMQLGAIGGMIGFVMLVGGGLAVIAGIVLLPAYASKAEMEYRRDCLRAENADRRAELKALAKLEKDLRSGDEVLIRREAESTLGLLPEGVIVESPASSRNAPPMVNFKRHAKPAPPGGMLIRMGEKLEYPPTRRGLSLLAVATLVAATFLFPSAGRTGRKKLRRYA